MPQNKAETPLIIFTNPPSVMPNNPKNRDTFELRVRTTDGINKRLSVPSSTHTVLELQQLILAQCFRDRLTNEVVLLFAGKVLRHRQTLQEAGIGREGVVVVFFKKNQNNNKSKEHHKEEEEEEEDQKENRSEQENGALEYRRGLQLWNAQNTSMAIVWLSRAASQGNTFAFSFFFVLFFFCLFLCICL